eukprot:TRINITY_DN19687_c0_g2_i2.p1 TRINITY_DN19687_c0_g2~~TRINITY_DN19687_c0_g2_i2.p1  ORF type:complete len:457 (-),score=123.79 TRINITY_DN19687_c0_g2_i2:20-1321(-)
MAKRGRDQKPKKKKENNSQKEQEEKFGNNLVLEKDEKIQINGVVQNESVDEEDETDFKLNELQTQDLIENDDESENNDEFQFEGEANEDENFEEGDSDDDKIDPQMDEKIDEEINEEEDVQRKKIFNFKRNLKSQVANREEIPLNALYDDQASDSSEDERPRINTIGDVPLEWYEHEKHIGYDTEGKKIVKKQGMDKLQWLLARNDSPEALRTIHDDLNGQDIVLSKEEIRMLIRLREGKYPHVEVNPYEPYNDWFSGKVRRMPITAQPERKSNFERPQWEEKKVLQLIKAMRKGWIKPRKDLDDEQNKLYLMWGDDNLASGENKTAAGLTYIPAPKPKLPGNEESYNPPKEFLPTEEEKTRWEMHEDSEEKPEFIPRQFPSLRLVPAYSEFIRERFERCLDLYLCPRITHGACNDHVLVEKKKKKKIGRAHV